MGILKLPSISTADRTGLVLQLREMVFDTDLNCVFVGDGITPGGLQVQNSTASGATWGNIVGTLSSQTDLQIALTAKENSLGTGTTSQYLRGDKTWQNFPSVSPSGAAGGDLTGTYPNPGVADDSHNHTAATLSGVVPTTRSVSTTSPITGGGALTSNLTLAIPAANGSTSGYLTSSDWSVFNNKLDTSDIKTINGYTITGGPGSVNITKTDIGLSNVTNDLQVTFNDVSSDGSMGGGSPSTTVVPNQQAIQTYVNNSIAGGFKFKGAWNADTNTPDLLNIGPNTGDAYIIDVAGTTDLNGYNNWHVNDLALYTENGWVQIDNSTGTIAWSALTGYPTDNSDLETLLDAKVESSTAVITKPSITLYDDSDATGNTIKSSEITINTTLVNTSDEVPTSSAVYSAIASAAVPIPDATTGSKGIVQLAGDLSGTAASPTVPGLASKENSSNKENTALDTSTTKYPSNNIVKSYVDTAISGVNSSLSGYQPLITPGDLLVGSPLSFSAGDGTGALLNGGAQITIPQADTSTSGYLTNTDWNTFNNKETTANKENSTLTTSNTTYPTCNVVRTYTNNTFAAKTNNLSDLSSISVARTNLGLGTSAVRDVPASGNATTSQVVLGNDSRLNYPREYYFQSNKYYPLAHESGGASYILTTNNTISYIIPYLCKYTFTINQIGFVVNTASPTGSSTINIYTPTNPSVNYTNLTLSTSVTIPTVVTNVNVVTLNYTFNPGLYYIVIGTTAAINILSATPSVAVFPSSAIPSTGGPPTCATISNTSIGPTVDLNSSSASLTIAPLLWVRKS